MPFKILKRYIPIFGSSGQNIFVHMGIVKEGGYTMGSVTLERRGGEKARRNNQGGSRWRARIRPIEAIYFLETACVPDFDAALFCSTIIDTPQSVTHSSQSPVRTDNHCQVTAIITNHNRHIASVLRNSILLLLINLLYLMDKSNHVTSKTKF